MTALRASTRSIDTAITRLKPRVNENIGFPQIKTYQIHQQIHLELSHHGNNTPKMD